MLTIKDLKKIKKMVVVSQTKVALPTKTFLEDESLWVSDLSKFDHFKMVDKLEEHKLRFKRVNALDSQENYTGYWVDKSTPFTQFESGLRRYLNTLDNSAKRAIKKMNKEEIIYANMTKYYLYQPIVKST